MTLLVLSLGAGLCALLLAIRLHSEKTRLAAIENKGDALAIHVRQLETEIRRVDTARREAAAVAAHRASDYKAITRPLLDLNKQQRDLVRLIHSHPQIEEKYREAEKGALGIIYHSLFLALSLSDDKQSQLLALLGGREQSLLDIAATALQDNRPLTDASVQAKAAQENLEAASNIQGLLGPAGYQQFQQYESIVNIRSVVGDLASNCYYDSPLTAEQSDRLIAALANAVPAGAPIDPLLADHGPPGTDWDAAVGEAAEILSPDQLVTFRLLAESNKAWRSN